MFGEVVYRQIIVETLLKLHKLMCLKNGFFNCLLNLHHFGGCVVLLRVITLHSVFSYDIFQLLVLLFKEYHEKVVIFYFTNSWYSCKFVKSSFNKTLKLTRYCCREKNLVSLTKLIKRLKK